MSLCPECSVPLCYPSYVGGFKFQDEVILLPNSAAMSGGSNASQLSTNQSTGSEDALDDFLFALIFIDNTSFNGEAFIERNLIHVKHYKSQATDLEREENWPGKHIAGVLYTIFIVNTLKTRSEIRAPRTYCSISQSTRRLRYEKKFMSCSCHEKKEQIAC